MKEKLSRIHSSWRRLLVSLVISCLLFIGKFQSPRTRIHWIGNVRRARRLERHLFIVLLFVPFLLLEPRQYLLWFVLWGGMVSVFVIIFSSLLIFKKAHV